MKKIYMILAVFALLSMSLSAQTKATITVAESDFSDAGWWTIISDGQGETWSVANGIGQYKWSSSYAANDWLVTSPITLQAGKTYTFTIGVWAPNTNWGNEQMEVRMVAANSAAGLSAADLSGGTSVIASTEVSWNSEENRSGTVTISTTGTYCFGIHAISAADRYYLDVDNMKITVENTDPLIIASPASVSMNAAPGGSTTEMITVTGDNLTEGITYTLTDANGVFSVSPASLGTSGGTLTITYSPTAPGNHTATLTLTSPGADPVTINLTGSCIAGTTYELVTDPSTQLVDDKEYIIVHGNYAMGALNSNGYGTLVDITDNGNNTVTVPGTASPMVLTLHNYSSNYTSGYSFQLENGSYLRGYYGSYSGYYLTTQTTANDYCSWTTVADVKSTGGYGIKMTYNYDSYRIGYRENDSYSNFGFYSTSNLTANSTSYFYGLLYKKVDEPIHDLGIALAVNPATVVTGETATFTATVTNNGNQTETGYTVTFSDGTTKTGGTLAPGTRETFTVQCTPTTAGTVTMTATVACTDDSDATNDEATATLTVNAPVHDLGITLSQPTAVLVGENATITATVTNNGNQTETGYTVTFSDGTNTFSTQTGGTLAPGATETFTATYTTSAAGTVTITANVACTGDADATNDEATATLTVTVPVRELTAPTNGSTVDVGENNGLGVSKTITVSGKNLTEDVTVSVSGAGFTVSPTTLSADAVNAGTATVTIIYNGTTDATGTLTFSSSEFANVTVNLTGSYSTGIEPRVHGMVRLGTLRIVDQFSKEIPATNDHPYRYTYFLKLAARDTTSSPARVPVQHTGAEVQGYYSLTQMDNDTDPFNFLEENIISAEVDMNLSPASAPYFYTINSVENGIPASVTSDDHYASYLNVLQRREAGDYQERQGKYGYTNIVNPNMDSIYTAGEHDFFDYRKVVAETTGEFLSYVPIVWTKGIDRFYYTTDSLHNSYGAPIWKVTRGDVNIYQDGTVCQRQVGAGGGWNASANYTVDGTNYSLYLVSVNAAGVLPKNSNVEYEPYMFRLWLHDETASLRNYTWSISETWSNIQDAGAYTENDGKWKLLDTKMCDNWSTNTSTGNLEYHPDTTYVISINQGTSANPQSWQGNIGFVAPIDGFTPELKIRFYYKIKGAPAPAPSGLRALEEDDHTGYVVVRGVNPDPGTAVREIVANGEIQSQTYYNVQGMESDKPFPGINIVVTRYSNGATTTTKVRY